MNLKECIELLKKINVPCDDDGVVFTKTDKLDFIESELRGTEWIKKDGGIYHMYTKKPLEEMPAPVLLLSSHADFVSDITEPFSEETEDGKSLHGTYDNSITNAALLSLMLENRLPDNAAVVFTGNEEKHFFGAISAGEDLKKAKKKFRVIVLDVSAEGWDEGCHFTIENNFWGNRWGLAVIRAAEKTRYSYQFAAVDQKHIPSYVPFERLAGNASEPDESWAYDEELQAEAFSLCIPVSGDMHSDEGVLARPESFMAYREALAAIAAIPL